MNSIEHEMDVLIKRHTELGQKGMFLLNQGNEEEGYRCFDEANKIWDQFMVLYNA